MDYVTRFSSSPKQQLRLSSLWQEIGNSWKLLLTVATESLVLNVTGLLCLTSKCIDKFRLRQKNIPSIIYMFKVNKKDTRATCQISSKSRIKTPEWRLVLLLLALNIFRTLFYFYHCWRNKCCLDLRNYSFRQ